MAIQIVKVGAAVNDGTGDPSRTCFTKINSNFTDTTHAASRLVGTENGNVMEGGAFGLGVDAGNIVRTKAECNMGFRGTIVMSASESPYSDIFGSAQSVMITRKNDYNTRRGFEIANSINNNHFAIGRSDYLGNWYYARVYTSFNTSVDANGFIKAASPIVKLFAYKIELNDEAAQQKITFEKLGVGNYLVKGSTGFAQDGWYIEMPKDANGNVLVSVIYKQLDNNDISVKTYAKMFDEETGDIVANTAKPRDIPEARWIDLRLQELPQDDTQPLDTDETVATNAE